ncbi:ROK family protein [Microbacterium sp. USHLN186]|uniref:ROK family protein n=1 Tax=Microbacterium sp. USHLN186 TaxID=3081286 RepID=UPI00301A553B
MHQSSTESIGSSPRARLLGALGGPPAQRTALRMVIAGVRSRAEIARESGLDTGTVTRAVTALIEAQVLTESTGAVTSRPGRGRPSRPLHVAEEEFWAVGLHIGVRDITASAVGLGGSSLARVARRHDGSVESALDACLQGTAAVRESMRTQPMGIGVAVGGRVDSRCGRIVEMPRLGWTDVPLADEIARATGLPCTVRSMAQAQAQANVVYGQVSAKATFGHLYVGYIVEYCVVIGGEVWAPEQRYGGAIDSLLLRTDDGRCGTVQELVSDDGILAQAHTAGLIVGDVDLDAVLDPSTDDPRERAALKGLLHHRAELVGDLVTQLQEVIALPAVVMSASMARQSDALDIVRERIAAGDDARTPPDILSGGPVEIVNPRSGACGYFETLFAEAGA